MSISKLKYSGLTYEQYDKLFSPSDKRCLSKIKLFFRKIAYFLSHCEWITDQKLINRFYKHVKVPSNAVDENVKKIYSVFEDRCNKNGKPKELQDMRQFLEPGCSKVYISAFSPDFHDLAYSVCMAFQKVWDQQPKNDVLCALIRDMLTVIENGYEKAMNNLSNSSYSTKDTQVEKLKNCLKNIQEHYKASLERLQTFSNDENDIDLICETFLLRPEELISHPELIKEIEIDLGIYDYVRENGKRVIYGIMRNDPNWLKLHPEAKTLPPETRESVANYLQLCRKFLCDRDRKSDSAMGSDRDLFLELHTIFKLDLDCFDASPELEIEVSNESVTRIYPDLQNNAQILACIEQIGNHSITNVYTRDDKKPHFVFLDNLYSPEKRKISLNEVQEMIKTKAGLGKCLRVQCKTAHDKHLIYPKPETWILPKWEKNNCFYAVAFTALAVVHFYQAQGLFNSKI